MEFNKLPPRLRFFVLTCTISGAIAMVLLFGIFSPPPVSGAAVPAALALAVLFWLARRFHYPLEAHVTLSCGTVVITSAFFICGPWILVPLVASGLMSDMAQKEKTWSMALNASCDALRVVPGALIFTALGGEIAFSRLSLPAILSSSGFFLWFIASDFLLLSLFTAAGRNERLSFRKTDYLGLIVDLLFFPLSILTVLTCTTLGPPYLLLVAVPVAAALYLYQYSLGKKTEVMELARLNNELTLFMKEKSELLAESQRKAAELRNLHEHLLQSRKLASLGKLAAGLAHELNTPLGAILTNAEFALSFADDRDMEESLQMIRKGALRCRKITEGLLAYSRKEEVKTGIFPFRAALDEALAELAPLLGETGIKVEIEAGETLEIQGVREHVIQILIILVKNGIEAILAQGEAGGTIAISGTGEGGSVSLSIRDNGTGMTGETRERIFDPFFTTKDVGKGTGLGLWIARHLVESHRGSMTVSSQPGRGSEFLVKLPYNESASTGRNNP